MSELDTANLDRPVRRQTQIWFAAICTLLSLSGLLAVVSLRSEVNRQAKIAEQSAVRSVIDHLTITDVTYQKLTLAALRVLQNETLQQGPAQIRDRIPLGAVRVPALFFGDVSVVGRHEIVDQVADLMGGTATLFVRDGESYVRIATNVKKQNGERAVGTRLDPQGKAMAAIRQGHPFIGVVDILGKPYFTAYKPIPDASGETIGIWYTGYPIETLAALRSQVENAQILRRGFIGLLDAHNGVMFQSSNVTARVCNTLVAESSARVGDEDWVSAGYRVHRQTFEPWGFSIVSATCLNDLNAETFQLVWKILGVMALIAMVTLYVFHRFADTIKAISGVMGELAQTSQELESASNRLAISSNSLSSGASQQASSVEETSASLEEVTSMIRSTADNAQKAKALALEARSVVAAGCQTMEEMDRTMGEMNQAMSAIESSSGEVAKIVKGIDEIAFQTNILALNAAVEAARAGAAGAGFAVVANEVRSLAQRSAAAARETADKIEAAIASSRNGSASCRNGSASSTKVGESLKNIADKISATDSLVAEIATAAREQSQGIEQINGGIAQMEQVTQSNASSAEESARAAEELAAQAENLKEQVGKLRQLIGGAAPPQKEVVWIKKV